MIFISNAQIVAAYRWTLVRIVLYLHRSFTASSPFSHHTPQTTETEKSQSTTSGGHGAHFLVVPPNHTFNSTARDKTFSCSRNVLLFYPMSEFKEKHPLCTFYAEDFKAEEHSLPCPACTALGRKSLPEAHPHEAPPSTSMMT